MRKIWVYTGRRVEIRMDCCQQEMSVCHSFLGKDEATVIFKCDKCKGEHEVRIEA